MSTALLFLNLLYVHTPIYIKALLLIHGFKLFIVLLICCGVIKRINDTIVFLGKVYFAYGKVITPLLALRAKHTKQMRT